MRREEAVAELERMRDHLVQHDSERLPVDQRVRLRRTYEALQYALRSIADLRLLQEFL